MGGGQRRGDYVDQRTPDPEHGCGALWIQVLDALHHFKRLRSRVEHNSFRGDKPGCQPERTEGGISRCKCLLLELLASGYHFDQFIAILAGGQHRRV